MSAPPLRRQPIKRSRVLIGGLVLLALVTLHILAGEFLRHPDLPHGVPEEQLVGADPRDEIVCPEPLPREGQERDETADVGIREVTSNNLYDCPQFHDGQRVRYRGEVVGALLHRDIGVWAQLNDDVYAELLGPLPAHRDYRGGNAGVGVLLPAQASQQITFIGGPQTRGDILEVEGVFNRVDPSGEVAVIRADTARLVADGEPSPDPVLTDRRIAAVLAFLLAASLVVAERTAARRR